SCQCCVSRGLTDRDDCCESILDVIVRRVFLDKFFFENLTVATLVVPYLSVIVSGIKRRGYPLLFSPLIGPELIDRQCEAIRLDVVLFQVLDDDRLSSNDFSSELSESPLLMEFEDAVVVIGYPIRLEPVDVEDVIVVIRINPDDDDRCIVSLLRECKGEVDSSVDVQSSSVEINEAILSLEKRPVVVLERTRVYRRSRTIIRIVIVLSPKLSLVKILCILPCAFTLIEPEPLAVGPSHLGPQILLSPVTSRRNREDPFKGVMGWLGVDALTVFGEDIDPHLKELVIQLLWVITSPDDPLSSACALDRRQERVLGLDFRAAFLSACIVTDYDVIEDRDITVHSDDASRQTCGKDRGVSDCLSLTFRVVDRDFSTRPLLALAFILVDHLWPVPTINLRGQNVLDELQLLLGEIGGR